MHIFKMLLSFPQFTSDTQATSHLPVYAKHSNLKFLTQTLPVLTESFNFLGSSPEEFKLLICFFGESIFHNQLTLSNNLACTDITLFFSPLVLNVKQRNLVEGFSK